MAGIPIFKCRFCGEAFKGVGKHISEKHGDEQILNLELAAAYLDDGLSARDIAARDDIWVSATAIVRYVSKTRSPSDLELARRKKISSSIKEKYRTREFDFVKKINSDRAAVPLTHVQQEKTAIDADKGPSATASNCSLIPLSILTSRYRGRVSGNIATIDRTKIEILNLKQIGTACVRPSDDSDILFFSDEWNSKRDICISMLDHRVSTSRHAIFARKCTVVEGNEGVKSFMDRSHISGYAGSSIPSFSLRLDDEIVAAISFRLPNERKGDGSTVEIARFCSALNTSVPGGFARLLAAAKPLLLERGFSKIMTYADLRFGSGQGRILASPQDEEKLRLH